MSAMQRAVAIVVALIVVAGIAVLVLNVTDEFGSGPDASSTPETSAEASAPGTSRGPSASPEASGSPVADEDEVLAELAVIEQQMVEIRGLPAAEIGPPDIITRAELGEELQAIFEEEYPPEERERDNIVLRALGLLEPDQDVAELQLELLGDQVLGFYDDVEKRMVVVTDAGLNPEAKLTYAHEYTHALQDAAFGLDSLETDAVGEDDRSLARTALIEGDATMAMLAWAFAGNLSQEELLEIGAGAEIPDTSGIPSWMVDQLQFPYTAGQAWVADMTGFAQGAPMDFGEVDAAYDDPPDSTEQVIHFQEAWEPREEPDEVDGPDIVSSLGDGWEEVEATTIGEAMIGMMLDYFGVEGDVQQAAEGWGGDRAVVASGPNGEFAVVWRLAWDATADADEFVAAYEIAIESLDFPATVEALPDGEVLVVHASSEELLEQTVDAAR